MKHHTTESSADDEQGQRSEGHLGRRMMRTVRGSRTLYDELRAVVRHYPRTEAVVFGLHDGGADTPARQTIITIPDDPELALDVDIQDVVWLETHQYLRRWAFGATWRIELL